MIYRFSFMQRLTYSVDRRHEWKHDAIFNRSCGQGCVKFASFRLCSAVGKAFTAETSENMTQIWIAQAVKITIWFTVFRFRSALRTALTADTNENMMQSRIALAVKVALQFTGLRFCSCVMKALTADTNENMMHISIGLAGQVAFRLTGFSFMPRCQYSADRSHEQNWISFQSFLWSR